MADLRFFVYDIRSDCESFIASFGSRDDANEFGKMKFGEHAFVTDVPLHGKLQKLFTPARKAKKAAPRRPSWRR